MAARKKAVNPETVEPEKPVEPIRFSKAQILGSKRFKERRDMVEAFLDSEKRYTIEEVEKMIETYQKGKVK